MSSDDQDLFLLLVILIVAHDWVQPRRRTSVVDDEDVLENRSVLEDCEDWDFRLFLFVSGFVLLLGRHFRAFELLK